MIDRLWVGSERDHRAYGAMSIETGHKECLCSCLREAIWPNKEQRFVQTAVFILHSTGTCMFRKLTHVQSVHTSRVTHIHLSSCLWAVMYMYCIAYQLHNVLWTLKQLVLDAGVCTLCILECFFLSDIFRHGGRLWQVHNLDSVYLWKHGSTSFHWATIQVSIVGQKVMTSVFIHYIGVCTCACTLYINVNTGNS